MSDAIIVALITGGLSLAGVIISGMVTARKNETALKVSQAITDTKIDELSRQMNKHNNLMERVFKLEGQVLECQHDIKDLKGYHKPNPTN